MCQIQFHWCLSGNMTLASMTVAFRRSRTRGPTLDVNTVNATGGARVAGLRDDDERWNRSRLTEQIRVNQWTASLAKGCAGSAESVLAHTSSQMSCSRQSICKLHARQNLLTMHKVEAENRVASLSKRFRICPHFITITSSSSSCYLSASKYRRRIQAFSSSSPVAIQNQSGRHSTHQASDHSKLSWITPDELITTVCSRRGKRVLPAHCAFP